MRSVYFLVLAITGLLACGDAVADTEKMKMTSALASDGINGNRLLRVQPTEDNDNDDTSKDDERKSKNKSNNYEDEDLESNTANSKKDEERGIIVDGLYQDDYEEWYKEGKTPAELAEELGLDDFTLIGHPIKRRIYEGYKRFYREACDDDDCNESHRRRFDDGDVY